MFKSWARGHDGVSLMIGLNSSYYNVKAKLADVCKMGLVRRNIFVNYMLVCGVIWFFKVYEVYGFVHRILP